MKKIRNISAPIICSFLFIFCVNSESKKEVVPKKIIAKNLEKHPKFNNYWYTGKAEITSYKLTQAKYGEIHLGTGNIFYQKNR